MAVGGRSTVRRVFGWLLVLIIAAAAVIGLMNRQLIGDHIRVASFEPSDRIEQILDDLKLTERGKTIFLASRPTVDGSQYFNKQCADVEHSEDGHVLGCFSHNRIRLFDVTDERIGGIVEVTAAHELLHAAYARLRPGERDALQSELQRAFDELSREDPSLAERMEVYEHLPPAAYANELHSVLGTEVRSLPSGLERHYARYFTDRDLLLDRFDAFHAVFTDLEAQASALDAEMTTLRADIERRNLEYEAAVGLFNADAAEFSERNNRFEFSGNVAEFDRIKAELRDRRDALEATLSQLQADIEYYNSLRDQLRDLGQVSTELDDKMNSSLAPLGDTPE